MPRGVVVVMCQSSNVVVKTKDGASEQKRLRDIEQDAVVNILGVYGRDECQDDGGNNKHHSTGILCNLVPVARRALVSLSCRSNHTH